MAGLLRASAQRRGGMLDSIVPGWQDKLWSNYPAAYKKFKVSSMNSAYESQIARHKQWQGVLTSYKAAEDKMKPSHRYRNPKVDWRRQLARGTFHVGRFHEGPPVEGSVHPSDYTPGNTRDRLTENVHAPFTDAEWDARKQHRDFDILKFTWALGGGLVLYRLAGDWPTVWC